MSDPAQRGLNKNQQNNFAMFNLLTQKWICNIFLSHLIWLYNLSHYQANLLPTLHSPLHRLEDPLGSWVKVKWEKINLVLYSQRVQIYGRDSVNPEKHFLLSKTTITKLNVLDGRKILLPSPQARKFYNSTWLYIYITNYVASLNTYLDVDDDI